MARYNRLKVLIKKYEELQEAINEDRTKVPDWIQPLKMSHIAIAFTGRTTWFTWYNKIYKLLKYETPRKWFEGNSTISIAEAFGFKVDLNSFSKTNLEAAVQYWKVKAGDIVGDDDDADEDKEEGGSKSTPQTRSKSKLAKGKEVKLGRSKGSRLSNLQEKKSKAKKHQTKKPKKGKGKKKENSSSDSEEDSSNRSESESESESDSNSEAEAGKKRRSGSSK